MKPRLEMAIQKGEKAVTRRKLNQEDQMKTGLIEMQAGGGAGGRDERGFYHVNQREVCP